MSAVKTNNVTILAAREATLGTLPGTAEWFVLEPDDITGFGATITTVPRNPISKNRQARKGTTTDLDSGVAFEADLTLEHLIGFIEAFMFAQNSGAVSWADDAHEAAAVSSCDTNSFTVESASVTLAQNSLIFVRGMVTTGNNGLKLVDAGATTTDIPVTTALTAEGSAPQKARIDFCGFRSAVGDLDVDSVSAGVVTMSSTALDFTTLPINVGQYVYFGGSAAANQFTNAANSGFGRILTISANEITFDKTTQTWVTEANTTQLVDIYFGKFIRNVDVEDADYIERSFRFEASYPDLGGIGTPEYEYAEGNLCNELAFQLPLTDKATMSFGFVGTNTPVPTASRQADAANALEPGQVVAFNTSADIARLRIQQTDETVVTAYFKELTFTLGNNVTPEKVLGTLGAAFMNVGNLDVTFEARLVFTDSSIPTAIRNNETLTMDFALYNEDGAFLVDVPSLTLGGGDKEFETNASVKINTTGQAFADASFDTSVSFSLFPYLPL